MFKTSLSKFACTAVAVAASFAATARSARADNLATLIATNGSITVGNLVFSNFEFASGNFNASNVTIVGVTINGNFGIQIQGTFGAAPGSLADAMIGYTVTSTTGATITDAHLSSNAAVLLGTGAVGIVENFKDPGTEGPVGFTSAEGNDFLFNAANSPGSTQLDDNGVFDPARQSVEADKDVLTISVTGAAQVSIIDQTYSQSGANLPVPAGIILALSGSPVLGLGYWLRRRQPSAKPVA